MDYKETILSKIQRDNIFYRGIGTLEGVCKMQAELSFKVGEAKGIEKVVEAVLAIIESPKQVNYRLKEITEYCEAEE